MVQCYSKRNNSATVLNKNNEPCMFVIKCIIIHGYTSDLKLALHKMGFGCEINIGLKMQNRYKL